MSWWLLSIALVCLLCALSVVNRIWNKRRTNFRGKHCFITGGSQGIGLAVAIELAKRGANVTILARTESKLAKAKAEIQKAAKFPTQKIEYICVDVTSYDDVQRVVEEASNSTGPIDYLFCAAGASYPGYFLDQDVDVFEHSMRLNYMGVVHACKAVAPRMVDRQSGHIILVASACACISFIGYSTYAPSKFAVRGLADSLRNELKGFGVKVSISYPPDTATPGFDNESKTKPAECAEISGSDAPYPSTTVASCMVDSLAGGDYHLSSPDIIQNLLVSTMAGVTPRNNTMLEVCLAGLLGVVEYGFMLFMDFTAGKYAKRTRTQAAAAKKGK